MNVGSATFIGGGIGLVGAIGSLKRSGNLKMATLTHSIRRSDTITAIVEKVRTRSGQGGSFGEFFLEMFSFENNTVPAHTRAECDRKY